MQKISEIEPKNVFGYFEELTKIPRGSGNMDKVSSFCMEFAKKHNLKAVRDDANNVIIFKPATKGFENSEPVILQGHMDIVCQSEENVIIDFEKEGLCAYVSGDYIKAKGTTLGADNGVAVAMILAILADDTIEHPAIEAVFTTDEEIGMVGALNLSLDQLKGRQMINIDSDDMKTVTVSCAGGSDFTAKLPLKRTKKYGKCIEFSVKGLKGGHSGVEINSGRVNANVLMGRILNHISKEYNFDLISIDGGNKTNAIPAFSVAKIMTEDSDILVAAKKYAEIIKEEIADREESFSFGIDVVGEGEYLLIEKNVAQKLLYLLMCVPNGVVEMSTQIENLVQTSLNLGILKTDENFVSMSFGLRSNKKSALAHLEEKLSIIFSYADCKVQKSGHYPPWEYNEKSKLEKLYVKKFEEKFSYLPKVEAIHAGLECGVFASGIKNFDCISIGAQMEEIHTPNERLLISSVKDIYELILDVLSDLK